MMAKKTVTSRACKQIVQQYGDVFAVEGMEKAEELADVDTVAEDVAYDIEQNANTVEFEDVVDEPQAVEVEGQQTIPEFMQE